MSFSTDGEDDDDDDDDDDDNDDDSDDGGSPYPLGSYARGKRNQRKISGNEISIVPNDKNFSPCLFLTLVHGQATLDQLRMGLQNLNSLLRQHSSRRENIVRYVKNGYKIPKR